MADTTGVGGKVASVMQESRVFPPPAEFSKRARIGSLEEYRTLYDEVARDPEAFWDAKARELPWLKPYTRVLDWQPPVAKRCSSWRPSCRSPAEPSCSSPAGPRMADRCRRQRRKQLRHGRVFRDLAVRLRLSLRQRWRLLPLRQRLAGAAIRQ